MGHYETEMTVVGELYKILYVTVSTLMSLVVSERVAIFCITCYSVCRTLIDVEIRTDISEFHILINIQGVSKNK